MFLNMIPGPSTDFQWPHGRGGTSTPASGSAARTSPSESALGSASMVGSPGAGLTGVLIGTTGTPCTTTTATVPGAIPSTTGATSIAGAVPGATAWVEIDSERDLVSIRGIDPAI